MKVRDLKVGEVFTTDNTIRRPKIKLCEGFVDMVSQYVYVNKENIEARILTGSELMHIQRNWKMTPEKFEEYKQAITKKNLKKMKNKKEETDD